MYVIHKERFDVERRLFAFCFTCEHCAHFDDRLLICIHGFPNRQHRLSYYEATPRPPEIVFCKDFDLA
ncbi:MAG: hypothetical protein QNJ97_02825 [Myxococcota bacterium]|nr:hypothetical protein [Myxococcota bacterium]